MSATESKSKGLRLMVQIIVEPDEEGFHAYCPALKGLHVGGQTLDEALKNAGDAVHLFLQDIMENGDPVPMGVIVEEIPHNAEIRNIEFLWPSLQMSGANLEA